METFKIQNLSFAYPDHTEYVINDLSLDIHAGEFVVLCGPSGCGKSTLLRQLKTILAPHGLQKGDILFEGQPLGTLDQRTQAQKIGFVQQSPENQIVTDKVWHELAFGLESLGYDTPTIRKRVAEMASFFGIEGWFYKDVATLSGGQKQLLNLASVMVMGPSVLILDEPTSQLDPIAASDFLAVLGKINRELGTTILLTEHRLEEAFPLATTVAVMDKGRLLCSGTPAEVGKQLKDRGHSMFLAMPTTMRVWAAVENDAPCPVTVREGRDWLMEYATGHEMKELPAEQIPVHTKNAVIHAEEVWFKYEKNSPDVVRGLSMTVHKGEFVALLGGNGAGKSTSLKLLSGLLQPYRGEIHLEGSVGVLPQNPQALFVKKTVREDLMEIFRGRKGDREGQERAVANMVRLCRLEELLDRHPYDLSGGEQQRAALAKILLLDPDILLLDEPTKGLDAEFKQAFAEILQVLLRRGVTILMVSHDVEFCARYAHRCALFFDGSMVTDGSPRAFFSGNHFYTTSANRMARSVVPEAVTAEDLMAVCGGTLPSVPELPQDDFALPAREAECADQTSKPLPWWRKVMAAVSGATALYIFFAFLGVSDLSALIDRGGLTSLSHTQLWQYGLFALSLLVFAGSISRKAKQPDGLLQVSKDKRKLSGRTKLAAVLILLLIPLTLFVGEAYFGGRKYLFISLLILLEVMAPFFMIFESRRPQARELVVIAVLCAIGVAGRTALFMLPEFKPVWAITIIAGVAFGGETGFLVGAMTMLASNMLFSQGPWTPWQMFAMGSIGFLAGVLFRKGLLRRSRLSLCIYGALACIVIYGGIMNPATAVMYVRDLTLKGLLPYFVSGIPIDCVHAAATWIFLWFAAEPMLEKLDRIKV